MWSSGMRAVRVAFSILAACFAVALLPSTSWAETSAPSPTVSDSGTPTVDPSATPSTSEPSSSPSSSSTSDPSATSSPTASAPVSCGDSSAPCFVTFGGETAAFLIFAGSLVVFLLGALLVSAWARG